LEAVAGATAPAALPDANGAAEAAVVTATGSGAPQLAEDDEAASTGLSPDGTNEKRCHTAPTKGCAMTAEPCLLLPSDTSMLRQSPW
jgi:hypothetical protein